MKFPMQIEKVYEPGRFEPRWAQWWVEHGCFTADANSAKPMFSLVIPPPNVTGSLHMGHMLEHTLIDMTVRWHRMSPEARAQAVLGWIRKAARYCRKPRIRWGSQAARPGRLGPA